MAENDEKVLTEQEQQTLERLTDLMLGNLGLELCPICKGEKGRQCSICEGKGYTKPKPSQ